MILDALEFTFDIGAGKFEWFPYRIDNMRNLRNNSIIRIGLMLWRYELTRL